LNADDGRTTFYNYERADLSTMRRRLVKSLPRNFSMENCAHKLKGKCMDGGGHDPMRRERSRGKRPMCVGVG
jgi:hypothetical protein